MSLTAREKVLLACLIIVIIVLGGVAYYFATFKPKPEVIELTLYTKAGLWADFIRKTGVLESLR